MGGHQAERRRHSLGTFRRSHAIVLTLVSAVSCTAPQFVDPPRILGDPLAETHGMVGDDEKLSWSVAIADGEGGRWCVDAKLVEGEAIPEPDEAGEPCNQLFPPDPRADRIAVPNGTSSAGDYTLAWGSVKRGTPICAVTPDGKGIPAEPLLGPWPFRVWVVAAKNPVRYIIEDCAVRL